MMVAAVMAAAAVSRPAGAADDLSNATIERAFTVASGHLADTTATLVPGQYPIRSDDAGTWVTGGASGWTSGFLAGALWFMYERTGEEAWRERAEAWQAGLEPQKNNTSTHDIGFMLFDSFGHGHRLTGNHAYR